MVGQVLAALERLGLAEDTLLMVTSDNGAMPGCLGRTYGHRSCGDWRGYKGYIWDGGHREPFLARWPGRIEPGSVCHQLAGLQDLMATAAALVGTELPPGTAPDSVNLLPALLGEDGGEPVRDHLVHHSSLGVFSLRTSGRAGNWKLIVECDNSGDGGRGVHRGMGTGPVPGAPGQLYRMGGDPARCTICCGAIRGWCASFTTSWSGFAPRPLESCPMSAPMAPGGRRPARRPPGGSAQPCACR